MEAEIKYVIFDTDMGSDDAWALQMFLKAEKHLKTIKVVAITAVNGNTTIENVIKNTYRILDGLDRTDVSIFMIIYSILFSNCGIFYRFQFIKEQLKHSSLVI